MEDLKVPGVEIDDLGLIHDIDEDMPLAIGDGRLGHTLERDGADHLRFDRIDSRGVLAAVIEGEAAPAASAVFPVPCEASAETVAGAAESMSAHFAVANTPISLFNKYRREYRSLIG